MDLQRALGAMLLALKARFFLAQPTVVAPLIHCEPPRQPDTVGLSSQFTEEDPLRRKQVRRGARGGVRARRTRTVGSSDEGSSGQSTDFVEQLNAGNEACAEAMASLKGKVCQLAFDKIGCRTIQACIDVATKKELLLIASELRGAIRKAAKCPNANYVVQKLVQTLPVTQVGFVVEELLGKAVEIARHSYGCRVICRLLEHQSCTQPVTDSIAVLTSEILDQAVELSCHGFGHHVVQSIVEHGTCDQRAFIAEALRRDLSGNAHHRNASFVVDKALVFCAPSEQQSMALELFRDADDLLSIASSQFGSRVAITSLRVPGLIQGAQDVIRKAAPTLAASKYGRRFLEELRRMSPCCGFAIEF